MKFGEFLLCQGTIRFNDIVDALDLQRERQETLGKLALARGLLTVKQVFAILNLQASRRKSYRDDPQGLLFGDLAVEFDYLTDADLLELLQIQRRSRPPIGEILVELGCLTYEQMTEALERHHELHGKDSRARSMPPKVGLGR